MAIAGAGRRARRPCGIEGQVAVAEEIRGVRLVRADQIARADPDEAEPLTAGEACQGLKGSLIQGSCASGGFGYGAAPCEALEARGLQLQDDRPSRKAGRLETAGHAFRQRPQGRGEHFQIGGVMIERGLGRDALGLANG